MTFERLLPVDWVAMLAALALLFVTGLDWYSTAAGEEARRVERSSRPSGALGGEVPREVEKRARLAAEEAEKNALQVTAVVDRAILAGLALTIVLALAAGFLRAAGRRFGPPLTPSALAALAAAVTALPIAYRALDQPGSDAATTVKAGLPLALVTLGVLALCGAVALRAEEAGTAWREPASAPGVTAGTPGEPAGDAEEPASALAPAVEREADDGGVGDGPRGRPHEGDVG